MTIATNMAGRGVDIKLGEGVIEAGGLYVLGTERHESRRIDNQLRGRCGRQGDPGETRFYLSAEDELIRLFAGDRMFRILSRLGPQEGQPLEAKMLSNVVEKAQVKVEELNFMRRKNVLKYDEVMNEQRRVIYDQRQRILMGEDFGEQVREMVAELVEGAVRARPRGRAVRRGLGPGQRSSSASSRSTTRRSRSPTSTSATATLDEVVELAVDDALAQYDERERVIGGEQMRSVERAVMLQVIDSRWKDHLLDMDYLQEGIHLRALGQRDPLVEYKGEGFELFQDMMESIKTSTVTTLMKNSPEDLAMFAAVTLDEPLVSLNYTSGDELITQTSFAGAAMAAGGMARRPTTSRTSRRRWRPPEAAAAAAAPRTATAPVAVQQRVVYDKVGRNDPCPCGSGKKYKKCHGA